MLTSRPEIDPPWDETQDHVTLCPLRRLQRGDGRTIAERMAGGKSLPEQVIAQILEQTDGVPLFVEELTKNVLESGFLEEGEDSYVLSGPLPALAIPSTLQDSLMARLDRLSTVKEVVQAAACIGREFSPDLLLSAITMSGANLAPALVQLEEAQLIFRRETIEGTRYIFKHALVQDAAYESLLKSKRQKIHAKLAAALEATAGCDPLLLARHFAAAGLAARAVENYLISGKRLLATSALPEAVGALELGLSQIPAIGPSTERDRRELDLRITLGTARMANFGWPHPSVAEALEPAFTLSIELDDRESLGPILWGLWVHYQTRTNFPRAHDWLAKLETLAEVDEGSELSVVRDMSAGCQYFWQAEYPKAAGYTAHLGSSYDPRRHAQIVNYANHDPLVFSLHWSGSLLDWITGYPDRALTRIDEALSVARRLEHPFNLAFALTAGSQSLIMRGNHERMLAQCDEAETVIEEEALGAFAENAMLRQWRGQALIVRGSFGAGYEALKQGNDFFNGAGGRICNAMWWCQLASALFELERRPEALALIERAAVHCRETGDRYMEPECLRLKGEFLITDQEAEPGAAEAALRNSVQLARDHDAKSWELRSATCLARLWQSQDRRTEARDILAPVHDWFEEGSDTADLIGAQALLLELT